MQKPTARLVVLSAALVGAACLGSACSTVIIERTPREDSPEPPSEEPESSTCPAFDAALVPQGDDGIDVLDATRGDDCWVTLAGAYFGAPSIGGVRMPHATGWVGFAARLDPSGNATWTRALEGTEHTWKDAAHVVRAAANRVFIGGSSDGALILGDGALLAGTGRYVLAVDEATGELAWASRVSTWPRDISFDNDKETTQASLWGVRDEDLVEQEFEVTSGDLEIRVVGHGSLDLRATASRAGRTALVLCSMSASSLGPFGLEPTDATPGTCDLVVALAEGEQITWARSFAEDGFQFSNASVALDDDGSITLVTDLAGAIDLGNGVALSRTPDPAHTGLLVASFAPDGATRWGTAVGDAGWTMSLGAGCDEDGSVRVSGLFADGEIVEGPLSISATELSGFEARFGADGTPLALTALPNLDGYFTETSGAPLLAVRQLSDRGEDLGLHVETASDP
ncbi:MAG: hypothetical protein U0271_08790 [Polyangiaceae bacterium]